MQGLIPHLSYHIAAAQEGLGTLARLACLSYLLNIRQVGLRQGTCLVDHAQSSNVLLLHAADRTEPSPGAQGHPVQQLLAILEDSTGSMQGTQEDPAAGSRAARQAWWAERQALDARMQTLLQDMQTCLGPWRWVPAVLSDLGNACNHPGGWLGVGSAGDAAVAQHTDYWMTCDLLCVLWQDGFDAGMASACVPMQPCWTASYTLRWNLSCIEPAQEQQSMHVADAGVCCWGGRSRTWMAGVL